MSSAKQFLTTHIRALVLGAVVVVVAAAGTTVAVADGGSRPANAAATTPPTTAAPAPASPKTGTKHAKVPHVRGTITTISPTQWTLATTKAGTVTVAIGPTTKFGTAKAPATASSFATGQSVVVLGNRQGTTLTATRIAVPPSAAANGPGTPASATPSTTTPSS